MFLAIDPANFIDPGEFQARVGRLVDMMKSSEPVDGYDEVLVAGEPEWRMEQQRLRDGIPIPQPPWDRLSAVAAELKISPPQPDAGR
jgi:LDH2 family malate/lactate/ureidoglycolate dehydrogenase